MFLLCVAKTKDEVVQNTQTQANNVIDYFSLNDLCNNSDKAGLLYNSNGKGETVELEIGGQKIISKKSEKLLGLNISSDFNWKVHCEKLASQLNQKVGLLRRMRHRVPTKEILIIAEAIFNSKIRYGCSVYLHPIFEKEDIKQRKLTSEGYKLQVIQNNMLRMIFNYKLGDKTNMENLRHNLQIFSVNQMVCYHVLLESFNIINYGSSEIIQKKWIPQETRNYPVRRDRKEDVKVHVPSHVS